MRIAFAIALGLACAAAQPALSRPLPHPVQPPAGDVLAAKLAYDAEIADQNRRSEALNVEVNRRNAAIEARNVAARKAYEKALADYHQALAQRDAAAAQAVAAYDASMQAWRVAVEACKAGDFSRCQAPSAASAAQNASDTAKQPKP